MGARASSSIWQEALDRWRPAPAWRSNVEHAAERIAKDPRGSKAVAGWAELAMVLGDSGAAGLALVVCMHAETLKCGRSERSPIAAHRNLCLLQLGLATPREDEPIPVVRLGDEGMFRIEASELKRWTSRELAQFGGDLERAANWVLALARARTGFPGTEPTL